MPNRIIKESICRSDSIDSLSWFEEVLFYRLIVVCDDYGRFDGRPAIIKGACFPLKDDITKKHISEAIDKLSTVGLVRGYEVQGRSYLQLTTWDCHQQIRAKKSKYPSPDETYSNMMSTSINKNQLNEVESNGNHLISDDCNSLRNRESKYENRESVNGNARAKGVVRRFDEFWDVYPNKQRRHLAEKVYCDLIVSGIVTEDVLVSAAANYAVHIQESGDRMFLPNNFLEKCVFEDYLEVGQTETAQGEAGGTEPEEELIGEDQEWWKYGLNAVEG